MMGATFSSDRSFGEIVRDFTARSHDLDWSAPRPDGVEVAYCIYCGAAASDRRPLGLPWVRLEDGPSLELACEGPTAYGEDGRRIDGLEHGAPGIGASAVAWVESSEHSGQQATLVLEGTAPVQDSLGF